MQTRRGQQSICALVAITVSLILLVATPTSGCFLSRELARQQLMEIMSTFPSLLNGGMGNSMGAGFGRQPYGQLPMNGMGTQPMNGMGTQPMNGMGGQGMNGMGGQYPQQGVNGQYPQQGVNGQYPQQGVNGQYPQQGVNGQYPQQGMNGLG